MVLKLRGGCRVIKYSRADCRLRPTTCKIGLKWFSSLGYKHMLGRLSRSPASPPVVLQILIMVLMLNLSRLMHDSGPGGEQPPIKAQRETGLRFRAMKMARGSGPWGEWPADSGHERKRMVCRFRPGENGLQIQAQGENDLQIQGKGEIDL
jgi:hypothetical protein